MILKNSTSQISSTEQLLGQKQNAIFLPGSFCGFQVSQQFPDVVNLLNIWHRFLSDTDTHFIAGLCNGNKKRPEKTSSILFFARFTRRKVLDVKHDQRGPFSIESCFVVVAKASPEKQNENQCNYRCNTQLTDIFQGEKHL